MRQLSDPILGVPEVSEMLGIPEDSLRWMRHVGKGPKSFKLGRRIAYLESEVVAYVQQQIAKEDERLEAMKDAVR